MGSKAGNNSLFLFTLLTPTSPVLQEKLQAQPAFLHTSICCSHFCRNDVSLEVRLLLPLCIEGDKKNMGLSCYQKYLILTDQGLKTLDKVTLQHASDSTVFIRHGCLC